MPLFAAYVKYVRTDRGLTLRRVAELISVDPSYMSRLERGEISTPSDEILTNLSSALDRPKAEVFLAAGRITPEFAESLERDMPAAVFQIGRLLETLATDPSEYAMPDEDDDAIRWQTPEDETMNELIHEGLSQMAQLADAYSRRQITKEQFEHVLESIRRIRLALLSGQPGNEKP